MAVHVPTDVQQRAMWNEAGSNAELRAANPVTANTKYLPLSVRIELMHVP